MGKNIQKTIYSVATPVLALILIEAVEVVTFQWFPNLRLGGFTHRTFPFGYEIILGVDFQFPFANVFFTAVLWGVAAFLTFFLTAYFSDWVYKSSILFAISLLVALLYFLYCIEMGIPISFRILCFFAVIVLAFPGVFFGRFLRNRMKPNL
ncbi:hypothetical protein AB3N59_19120 [Leptospira sp. WS92.C1]